MECQTLVPELCDCGVGSKIKTNVHSRRLERFYIGPGVNEIIVAFDRAMNMGTGKDSLTARIDLKRHSCKNSEMVSLVSYGIDYDNQTIHFDLKGEFLSDGEKFPRGFYKGKLFINDCYVDDIEIIKATSFFISDAQAVSDKCSGGTEWVEPPCDGNEDENKCDDCSATTNGCPNCLTHEVISVHTVKDGYLSDLSGLEEDEDDNS